MRIFLGVMLAMTLTGCASVAEKAVLDALRPHMQGLVEASIDGDQFRVRAATRNVVATYCAGVDNAGDPC